MRTSIVWLSLLATEAIALSTSASYGDQQIQTEISACPATSQSLVARAMVTETLTLGTTVIDCGDKACTVTKPSTDTVTSTITVTETNTATVTSTTTETVSISGSARPTTTITNTATVTSVETQTVTQTVSATASTTLTKTISIPASTVIDISSTTITVGQPTTTVTSTLTMTAGESTVTLPGSTVTIPGGTVTLPIPTILTIETTMIGSSIVRTDTVPGTVSTFPASTTKSVLTIPASTVTLPGGTSIIPGLTRETVVTYPPSTATLPGTTKVITVTFNTSRDSILAPGSTSTKTQISGSPVAISVSVCSTLISNPTYTPPSKLPSDYTWGCPPGFLCFPSRTGNRSGCNVESGLPDEGYICALSDCIPAPRLILNQSWAFDTDGEYFNYSRDYYNLDPEKFGLEYNIFRNLDEHNAIQSKRDLSSLQGIWPISLAEKLMRRDLSNIPSVCYNDCNHAALEQQATGKRPKLCENDSAYSLDLENCKTCIRHHESSSSDGFLSSLLPSFAQFLNYCSDLTLSATQATAEATSSSSTTATTQSVARQTSGTMIDESSSKALSTGATKKMPTGSEMTTTMPIESIVAGNTSAVSFEASEFEATTVLTTIFESTNTLGSLAMTSE